ncbi:MAG TPA: cob(I)yrinic acid a,c-diamide adenosyltransferase [Prevotella sp.]|nr:cob(I)yrinic acid a,c-diamide adenosyltransferase [Prevotella sp.]
MIYTKSGDQGITGLRDGQRVPKDDPRIEVNGEIDELNSLLGVVRASFQTVRPDGDGIRKIQLMLMDVMSWIAALPSSCSPGFHQDIDNLTKTLEQHMDKFSSKRSFQFVVPGDIPSKSIFHVARSKTRTVERHLWSLNRTYPVNPEILRFFNRLSDYLFVLSVTE